MVSVEPFGNGYFTEVNWRGSGVILTCWGLSFRIIFGVPQDKKPESSFSVLKLAQCWSSASSEHLSFEDISLGHFIIPKFFKRCFFSFLMLLVHLRQTKSPAAAMSLWTQEGDVPPGDLFSRATWWVEGSMRRGLASLPGSWWLFGLPFTDLTVHWIPDSEWGRL